MPDIKALAEKQLEEEKIQKRVDLYKKLVKQQAELTKRETKKAKELKEALVKVLDESVDIDDIETDDEDYNISLRPWGF